MTFIFPGTLTNFNQVKQSGMNIVTLCYVCKEIIENLNKVRN